MLGIMSNVVVPAFVVIVVGGLLATFFELELHSLNRIALYAATPALIFNSIANSALSADNVLRLVAGLTLFLALMAVLAWLASMRFEATTRRGFVATSVYNNSANMMLPVTLFAFGEAGLERALLLLPFTSLALFGTAPLILSGQAGASRRTLLRVSRLPVLWAAALGFTFNALGWSLPLGLARGLQIVGDAAIPLVLLMLGLQMVQAGLPRPSAVNWLGSGSKLLVAPLVGYGSGVLVGLQGLDLAVLTLLTGMPPAVNTFMLALEFGGNAEEVARTVVLATALSLLSISIIVGLLATLL